MSKVKIVRRCKNPFISRNNVPRHAVTICRNRRRRCFFSFPYSFPSFLFRFLRYALVDERKVTWHRMDWNGFFFHTLNRSNRLDESVMMSIIVGGVNFFLVGFYESMLKHIHT